MENKNDNREATKKVRLLDGDDLLQKFQFRIPCTDEASLIVNDCVAIARTVIMEAPTVAAVPVPCKIGDEVWGLKKCRYRTSPAKGVVHHMYFGEDMRLCICVRNVCRGEWGKNVFATKEEAEFALAEMKKKGSMAIVSSSPKENEYE